MFIDFINRILGTEKVSVSNRLENDAEPSVIVKKDSNPITTQPIPEKYKKDIASLQSKYGDAFKTGLCINLTLQEALSIMPRVRRRRIGFIQRFAILFDERMGYNINDQISKN